MSQSAPRDRREYTVIGTLAKDARFVVHLAATPSGDVVELVERSGGDDGDGYSLIVQSRATDDALRRLLPPDEERAPRLLCQPFFYQHVEYGVYAHTPSISFVELDRRAVEHGGLAAPLVVALAIDLLEVLVPVHGDARAHGRITLTALAAAAAGYGRFVTFDGDGGSTVDDVAQLGRVLKRLATGAGDSCRDDIDALELRDDLPPELTERLDAMIRADVRATDAVDDLARDMPWARWTQAQVADELRALIPHAR